MTRRTTLALGVLAGVIASALIGGIAWAAIPGPGGVINGCYDTGGNLRVVDSFPCPKKWEPLTWNQTGPPGSNGTNGTNGISPTVTQLAAGNANCPSGGAAITDASNSTAYVCNGAAGVDGDPFSGTFTAGDYSISVTTSGITLAGPSARKIEMTNSGMTIDGGALPVSIEGGAFEVDALTIDATASATASIKGGASFTAEGTALAEIKSSGVTKVTGSAGTEIDGAIIRLGAGCGTPVAKVGSVVDITSSVLLGTVLTGDPTVLVC